MLRCAVYMDLFAGKKSLYLDISRDKRMVLTSVIIPDFKNDNVKVRTYANLEDLSAAEMRDLWAELKKPYISPFEIMDQIRADVIDYLQTDGRVDLVAVCLDSADPMEDKKRL